MSKYSYYPLVFLLLIFGFANKASAQQYIESCENLFDKELTLLCYQFNIVSELQAYWYRLPRGTISLSISEEGQINDLLIYNRWDFSPSLPKIYNAFHIDWLALPVPKTTIVSPDNYYQLLIEVLPNGEIIAVSNMQKKEF